MTINEEFSDLIFSSYENIENFTAARDFTAVVTES